MLIGWQLECKVKALSSGPKSSSIWLQRSHYITAEGLPNKVTWVCFSWHLPGCSFPLFFSLSLSHPMRVYVSPPELFPLLLLLLLLLYLLLL